MSWSDMADWICTTFSGLLELINQYWKYLVFVPVAIVVYLVAHKFGWFGL